MTSDDDPIGNNPNTDANPPQSSTPNESPPSEGDSESMDTFSSNSGGVSPSPSGHAPPPSGGRPPGRKLNIKRIGVILVVVGLIIGGGGLVMFGSTPSLPSLGGCNADTPTASFVTHQSSGDNGERVALQLEQIESAEHVLVMDGETEAANMTGVGNTTTVTDLSSDDTIQFVGYNKCGQHDVGSYTVE